MPTWTAERTTVNQHIAVGAESLTALGTKVACTKLLEMFSFDIGIDADVMFYRGTGRKYPSTQEENKEWSSVDVSGNMDYNGVIYPLGGVFGAASPVAHGTSVTAKDWIFTPPITGSIVPQTLSIEQGDAVRAHSLAYGLFTDFGYKGTRTDITLNGTKMIAQPLQDAITLTASPVAVPIAPIVSKHLNLYLDSSAAALGTTQLLRALSIDFAVAGVYSPLWVFNRTNASWAAHVDTVPASKFKLKLEADAQGMALLGYLQSGVTYYLRANAQGNAIAADGPGTVYNVFQHDMAIKVGKPTKFADDQGVFAIEWECTIVEDNTWGKSQMVTVTNLIASL